MSEYSVFNDTQGWDEPMPTATDKMTVEEICYRQQARAAIAPTMHKIFQIAVTDVDFLLAELNRLKRENDKLNQLCAGCDYCNSIE